MYTIIISPNLCKSVVPMANHTIHLYYMYIIYTVGCRGRDRVVVL